MLVMVVAGAAACTGGEKTKKRDCSGPPPPLGGGATLGGVPVPTAEVAVRSTNGEAVVPSEGGTAAITFAPQGGFIVLAGVRTQGFDECIELTAAIRDQEDGNVVVSLEQRPAYLVEADDGWRYPHFPNELFNWANLPACQTGIFTRDFHGLPYLFEMVVTDGENTSTATRTLVPWCAFEDGYCFETCTLDTSMSLQRPPRPAAAAERPSE